MLPEPNPDVPAKPEQVDPRAPAPARAETIVALQSHIARMRCDDQFGNRLAALAAKSRKRPEESRKLVDRLESKHAHKVLLWLHAHSEYISDSERAEVGISSPLKQTAYSLAKSLEADAGCGYSFDALRARVTLIIDAATSLGLVEPADEGRKNRKPVRATRLLHDLMVETGKSAALLLREALENRAD